MGFNLLMGGLDEGLMSLMVRGGSGFLVGADDSVVSFRFFLLGFLSSLYGE